MKPPKGAVSQLLNVPFSLKGVLAAPINVPDDPKSAEMFFLARVFHVSLEKTVDPSWSVSVKKVNGVDVDDLAAITGAQFRRNLAITGTIGLDFVVSRTTYCLQSKSVKCDDSDLSKLSEDHYNDVLDQLTSAVGVDRAGGSFTNTLLDALVTVAADPDFVHLPVVQTLKANVVSSVQSGFLSIVAAPAFNYAAMSSRPDSEVLGGAPDVSAVVGNLVFLLTVALFVF